MPLKDKIIKNKEIYFILLIYIFHIVNNYIIIIIQNFASLPVSVLESKNYAKSLQYLYLIKESILKCHFPSLLYSSSYSTDPPFYLITTLPFYFLFGNSKGIAIMSNSLYFFVLLVSIYYIGKKIMNKETGLLACFLVSMIPGVFGYSRVYHIPFALMALTTASICFLLYTDNFTNRKYSILFGISAGLLGLTKFIGAIYLIGPFIYFYYNAMVRQSNKYLKIKIINFLTSTLICIFLLSIFYIFQMRQVWRSYSTSHNMDLIFNWKSNVNLDYLHLLMNSQLLPVFSVLFFMSLVFFLFFKMSYKWILLTWIAVPYSVLTLFWNARESYMTIPCLPAMALIASFIIVKVIFEKKVKFISILIIVFFSIFQFIFLSYGNIDVTIKDSHLRRLAAGKRLKDEYQKLFQQIFPIVTSGKKDAKILFLSITNSGITMESLLHEVNMKNKLGLIVTNPLGCISGGGLKLDNSGFDKEYFLDSDFIISDSKTPYTSYPLVVRSDLRKLMDRFEEYKKYFLLVKETTVEDFSNLLIYKRLDVIKKGN